MDDKLWFVHWGLFVVLVDFERVLSGLNPQGHRSSSVSLQQCWLESVYDDR